MLVNHDEATENSKSRDQLHSENSWVQGGELPGPFPSRMSVKSKGSLVHFGA